MKKVFHQVQIRAKHRHAFRSGEWVSLAGVAIVQPDVGDARMCYFVAFPDGTTDYWPASDPDNSFDMRPAGQQ